MKLLQPLRIRDNVQLSYLADEMVTLAGANPITDDPGSAGAAEETGPRPAGVPEILWGTGLCRVLHIQNTVVAVSFSLDAFRDPPLWRLSLALATPGGAPDRVPEPLVQTLATAFFGGSRYKEVGADGASTPIRHFIKAKHDGRQGDTRG
jgi:hypothetical protein